MARKRRSSDPVEQVDEHPVHVSKRLRLNGSQERACEAVREYPVSCFIGNAGTGKSFVALYMARELLQNGDAVKVVVVRSPLEVSRGKCGYIPGDLAAKMAPWAASSFAIAKELGIDKNLEIFPLSFIQGMTFTDTVVIVEECQSLTLPEFEAVVTRLGLGSTMIFTGDPHQDLARSNGLVPFLERMENVRSVAIVRFDPKDNQRHPVVREICEALWND
jgi:phosphate starvation-inducible PhoH-like protein